MLQMAFARLVTPPTVRDSKKCSCEEYRKKYQIFFITAVRLIEAYIQRTSQPNKMEALQRITKVF